MRCLIEVQMKMIVVRANINNNADVHLITKMAASVSLMSDLIAMGSTASDNLSTNGNNLSSRACVFGIV